MERTSAWYVADLSTRRRLDPVNVGVIRRLGALTLAAMSLIACGSSGGDGSSTVASTTGSPATTAAPAPTTEVPDGGGPATCDVASVAEVIGGDLTAVFDLTCVDGWVAAYYTDNKGISRPVILKAEGQVWILQDWNAVCEGDPMVPGDIAVPESLRVYCPGG